MNHSPFENDSSASLADATTADPATDFLVFVCDAESGVVGKMADVFRRLVFSDDACPLYMMTHDGPAAWQRFRNSLPLPSELLFRDEFTEKFDDLKKAGPNGFSPFRPNFPSVLAVRRHPSGISEAVELICPERIGRCDKLSCFEKVVRRYLEKKFPDSFAPQTPAAAPETDGDGDDADDEPSEWRRRKEVRDKIRDVSEDISS